MARKLPEIRVRASGAISSRLPAVAWWALHRFRMPGRGVLARKAVLLADDGGRPIYYPEPGSLTMAAIQGASSATSIGSVGLM